MSILSNLTKVVSGRRGRVGRGIGSGSGGHTTGRGTKGDKARGYTKLTFDGSKIKKSWIQRTPRLRGKNKLKTLEQTFLPISLSFLDKWYKKGATVDQKSLEKLTGKNQVVFKIVGTGKLTKKLILKDIKATASALAKLNQ